MSGDKQEHPTDHSDMLMIRKTYR